MGFLEDLFTQDFADFGDAGVSALSDALSYSLGGMFPGMASAEDAASFWGEPITDYSSLFTPELSGARSTGATLYDDPSQVSFASGPSMWDSFNSGLQKIGDFTNSNGGKLLMGGLGGLASYLDAKKRNALMKQMMEQAAAEKAARAAKSAQYDAPARVTNMKTALPSWGAGTQAFSGNSLKAMTPRSSGTMYAAKGGSTQQTNSSYVSGEAPGQSDRVPAMLSDGEFVIDADTVSALGDGNNAAGASALEKMRQNIRRHKRAAPANKIPPKAKKPEAYLKGSK